MTKRYNTVWSENKQLKIIVFLSNGKAFSVGGDVKKLYFDSIDINSDKWLLNHFFLEEHTLDFYMSKLKVIFLKKSKFKSQYGTEL